MAVARAVVAIALVIAASCSHSDGSNVETTRRNVIDAIIRDYGGTRDCVAAAINQLSPDELKQIAPALASGPADFRVESLRGDLILQAIECP